MRAGIGMACVVLMWLGADEDFCCAKLRVGGGNCGCVRRVAARMKGAYIFCIGDGARRVAQCT